ncbi:MAG: succinate dehydrogenase [Rhizobiaceae bacterium]|nr:succinate dehydrogenase [Rhizobiaceae bacterium]
MERTLFKAQRISAILLAPWVLIHLGLILYAVRGGLTAAEILDRTQGSLFWGLFYGSFVLLVTVHAPIGLRNILREWTPLKSDNINPMCFMFGLFILVMGIRAVAAVVG